MRHFSRTIRSFGSLIQSGTMEGRVITCLRYKHLNEIQAAVREDITSTSPIMSAASTPSPTSPLSSRSSSLSSNDAPRTPPNMHQNTIDPAAKWLVQKYGGTSVGKFAAQIAENIIPCVHQGQVALLSY